MLQGQLWSDSVKLLTADPGMQVDKVGRSNRILAVPMLRLTLDWAAKLKGNALAQPLVDLLADCCLRLRAHFAQFIMDQVGGPPCCL